MQSESDKDQSVASEAPSSGVFVGGDSSIVNVYSASSLEPASEEPFAVSVKGEGSTVNIHSGQAAEAIPSEKPGVSHYEDFISNVLDNTLARKGTIEQRGISVVTTAGTLVTIVFAVVSFVLAHVAGNAINPHSVIRGSIDSAAILFVVAAGLGLLVNLPVPYGEPHPLELADILFTEEDEGERPADSADQTEADKQQLDPHSVQSSFQTAIEASGQPEEHPAVIPTRSITSQESRGISARSRFFIDTADDAAWKIAATRVKLIRKARRWNFLKAQLLFLAILSEVVAIGLLAWGVHRLVGL
jgi:hypothetical protein